MLTVLDVKFSKMKTVFFLMNSLCGLKANGPFSTKSWPGTLWKLKSGHFEPANHNFEAKSCHVEAKMKQFDAKMKHFEAKIKTF